MNKLDKETIAKLKYMRGDLAIRIKRLNNVVIANNTITDKNILAKKIAYEKQQSLKEQQEFKEAFESGTLPKVPYIFKGLLAKKENN